MIQEIKIPFGKRENRYLHISEVSSGLDCRCQCPGCGVSLVAKKGEVRKHHFAHSRPAKCLPNETLLHLMGKEFLAQALRRFIEEGKGIKLEWKCDRCGSHHKGSPFQNAREVAIEQAVGGFVPDLTLFGDKNRVLAVFEVVVSHQQDIDARRFYSRSGIAVFEFHLKDFDDLEKLHANEFLLPDQVSFCPRTHCVKCRKPYRQPLHAVVSTAICPGCDSHFPVAYIAFCEEGGIQPVFDSSEIIPAEWARELGANLEKRFDPVVGKEYSGNVCPKCRFFLRRGIIGPSLEAFQEMSAERESLRKKQVGFGCFECARPPVSPTAHKSPAQLTLVKRCVAGRMVDFHFASGKRYRETYYVHKLSGNQDGVTVSLTNGKGEVLICVPDNQIERVGNLVEDEIKMNRDRGARVVEQTAGWVPWEKGFKFHPRAFERYPWRFDWNPLSHSWEGPETPPKPDESTLINTMTCTERQNPSPPSREAVMPSPATEFVQEVSAPPSPPRDFSRLIPNEEGCAVCGSKVSTKWIFRPQTDSRVCWNCY